MKKEKTIRTYQRRTKTGKVVTVKQHTAKYDAAEALKEAAKKKGAGDELEALKNKKPEKVKETLSDEELREIDYPQKDIDAVAKALGLTQREAASWMAGTDFSGYRKADMKKGDKAAKKYLGNDVFSKLDPTDADVPLAVLAKLGRKLGGSKFMRVRDLVNASKAPKAEKAPKSDSSYGFTADEYKAWYHWDQDADPKNAAAKKVEKALKAKMGAKGYKKYFDEMTDSYSSRGHNKAFKGLGEHFTEKKELAKAPNKDAKAPKSKAREDLPEMKHGGDYKKDAGSHAVATSQLKKEGFKLGKDNLFHHEDGRTAYIDTKSGKWMIKEAKSSKESKAGKGPVGSEYEGPATLQTYKGDLSKASVRKMEGGKGYHITSPEGYSLARFSTKAAADKALASRTFDDKHSAKVEEWKQNGNVRGLQKEIAKIKLQYGNDRKKAAKLIKPLEEAIAAAKSSSKKETKSKESSKESSTAKSSSKGFIVAGLRMNPTDYNARRTFRFDPESGEVYGKWNSSKEKRLTKFLNTGNRATVANAIEKNYGAEARKKFFEAAGVEDKPKKVLTKAEQRAKKQKEDAAYARKMKAKGYVPIEGPLGKGWAKKEYAKEMAAKGKYKVLD